MGITVISTCDTCDLTKNLELEDWSDVRTFVADVRACLAGMPRGPALLAGTRCQDCVESNQSHAAPRGGVTPSTVIITCCRCPRTMGASLTDTARLAGFADWLEKHLAAPGGGDEADVFIFCPPCQEAMQGPVS